MVEPLPFKWSNGNFLFWLTVNFLLGGLPGVGVFLVLYGLVSGAVQFNYNWGQYKVERSKASSGDVDGPEGP